MFRSYNASKLITSIVTLSALTLSADGVAGGWKKINTQIGADNNSFENAFIQPQDAALSGGGRDQTIQFGDVLKGTRRDDLLIGGLGTDILVGGRRDDVLVGGIEHFNPLNRDRAFGGPGQDIFVWKPGDGSDLWDGGRGRYDVMVFGKTGEVQDGNVVFNVSFDQETAEVAIDPVTGLPLVDVSGSPGFCNVIDSYSSLDAAEELNNLGLDHLVQFFIRTKADSFEQGTQDDDNGLRVTLHLKDVEILVCTDRDGGDIEILDLTVSPPQPMSLYDIRSFKMRKRLEGMIF